MNIKIGDYSIEVAPKDALEPMTWYKATTWCESLGEGWRLPTKEELDVLYGKRNEIGGFSLDLYWGSSECDNDHAWTKYFYSGSQYVDYKNDYRCVRTVRSVQ